MAGHGSQKDHVPAFKEQESMMVTILLVEDDAAVRLLTRTKLHNQYHILEAGDGREALEVLDHKHVDLMIVDIMMPNMDGYEFVDTVRSSHDMTPVIMLTAMDTFAHKKKGYMLGIDDYLTKPINYEELVWHIEALLRRAKIASESRIVIGDPRNGFILSESSLSATWKGQPVDLTEKEFQLLYKLLSYPGQLFTKQQIMDEIWGYDTETDYAAIKTYINRIRRKLGDCDMFRIVSVRGLGYKAEVTVSDHFH